MANHSLSMVCVLLAFAFASQPCIPQNIAGQARFGCLTLTLSLSRFVPDLEATIARYPPQKLKRAGKPELTRGHGL